MFFKEEFKEVCCYSRYGYKKIIKCDDFCRRYEEKVRKAIKASNN